MSRFAKTPVGVFCDDRLTLRQIRVLGAILSYADANGRCHPTHAQIAARSCVRERDVAVLTRQLCDLGWLEKIGNGGRSSPADYRVKTTHDSWVEKTTHDSWVDTAKKTTHDSRQKPPTIRGKNHPRFAAKTTHDSGVGIQQTNQQTINRPSTDQLQHPPSTAEKNAAISGPRKPALTPEMREACRATWEAYSDAYQDRYGIAPVKNARVAGQVVSFVKRVGMAESAYVAGFFPSHQARWYVQVAHSVDALLRDAEKLRMEWATRRRITSESARQADASQSNFNAAEQAKAMLAARRAP